MKLRKKSVVLLIFIAYVAVLLFFAILHREPSDKYPIQLVLFKGLLEPGPTGYRDLIQNILFFIPIGALAGLLFEKHRLVKVLSVGLSVSLIIECSQLIWHRGMFDVNDLFNNVLGAFVGEMTTLFVLVYKEKNRLISNSSKNDNRRKKYKYVQLRQIHCRLGDVQAE